MTTRKEFLTELENTYETIDVTDQSRVQSSIIIDKNASLLANYKPTGDKETPDDDTLSDVYVTGATDFGDYLKELNGFENWMRKQLLNYRGNLELIDGKIRDNTNKDTEYLKSLEEIHETITTISRANKELNKTAEDVLYDIAALQKDYNYSDELKKVKIHFERTKHALSVGV